LKLSEAVRLYVERKQSTGCKYLSTERILTASSRQMGNAGLANLTPTKIATFLSGPRTSTVTWRAKHGALRVFFEYWAIRDQIKTSPMPPNLPKPTNSFVPYIYSRAELRRLLDATAISQQERWCRMSAGTFRTLLLFLYATGMRLGEAIKLKRSEVNLTNGVVMVRDTKFYKSRLVPLGSELQEVLRQYLSTSSGSRQPATPLFFTKSGEAVTMYLADLSFKRLRRCAGIKREETSSFQPRIHDLRHTFAVHRLISWYKQGANVQRLLPALSTYLGHVELKATQRYLTMTPELLREANGRFESYVFGEIQ
jgi:integrase/recombinase XerD